MRAKEDDLSVENFRMDKTREGRLIATVAVLLACGLFYLLAVELPGWGSTAREEEMLKEWEMKPWKNEPVILDAARIGVMTKLLELDRGEIQYWEEKLFTVSFWVNTAILAIVSFALQKTSLTNTLRWVCAFGCLALCAFYLIFVDFSERAMVANDHDVRGIQYALGLSKPGRYLKEQVVYEEGCPKEAKKPSCEDYGLIGHGHIRQLVRFNVLIMASSVLLLLVLLPLERLKRGRTEQETGPRPQKGSSPS